MSASRTTTHDASPWATGLAVFAGALMITAGVFQFLQAMVALFNDEFFVVTRGYTYEFDVTTWGWIHLVIGIVLMAAGAGLVSGRLWARALAILIASLSAIANFLWLPYYPIWATILIALDVAVIWAVSVYQPPRP